MTRYTGAYTPKPRPEWQPAPERCPACGLIPAVRRDCPTCMRLCGLTLTLEEDA